MGIVRKLHGARAEQTAHRAIRLPQSEKAPAPEQAVLPEFDYFGVTPVSRGQWERIAARSRDEADWRAVIDEAAPWAEASFARHGVISILGL